MKAKSVNTGTSDVTLMSVVPVTSVVTVRSAGTMKNAVTVTSCSCDCAKCCEFGEYQITKTTESNFRFFTFFPRRLMLMCWRANIFANLFSVIFGILMSISSISDYYHCHSLFCKEMAVVEAILAMIKEASPRLYVLDALVTFDGRDDSTSQ